jgi:hypothetical protein
MAFTNAERQARYRQNIRIGKTRRLQLVLPQEVGLQVDYLCQALQCNKTELMSRLITEEWTRQGQPIPGE